MEIFDRIRRIPHYREVDYPALAARHGPAWLEARLKRQLFLYDRLDHSVLSLLRRGYYRLYRQGVRCTLLALGVYGKAQAQARAPVLVEREVPLRNLPEAFDGFRVLQVSDFHFDFNRDLPVIAERLLRDLSFDICVLTGDYRGEVRGPFIDSLGDLEKVRGVLGEEVYAILGNHDSVEMSVGMEALGIRCLINESVSLQRGGARIELVGIDDPHFYRTHEFHDFPRRHPSILLSHSPEVYADAAARGFDLLLCGHTHGGQLCLPGGRPVITHSGATPRHMTRGEWTYAGMQGYTSPGIGASGLDCRLNCPPEVTVHILRRVC